jgi:hypothetical protein
MSADHELKAALLQDTRAFTALREDFSPTNAMKMLCTDRPDVFRGEDVARDARRARRITDNPSDRAALFEVMFGLFSGALTPPIRAWLDDAPAAEPLRSLEEEATQLLEALLARGIIEVDADARKMTIGMLTAAARFREVSALQLTLDALFGMRKVRPGKTRSLARRMLDRIVAPNQPLEVPAFDPKLLGEVLQVLERED